MQWCYFENIFEINQICLDIHLMPQRYIETLITILHCAISFADVDLFQRKPECNAIVCLKFSFKNTFVSPQHPVYDKYTVDC